MAMWERALFGVFPSKWPEPLATVVHEAMSNGRPVIGTTPGGHEDMIDDGETGFLVPGGDPDALAAAMARLIDDAALRERLGARGKATREPLHPRSGRPSARALLLRHDRCLAGEVVVRRLSAPWWGDLTAVVALTFVALRRGPGPGAGAGAHRRPPAPAARPPRLRADVRPVPARRDPPDLRLVLSVAFSVGVAAIGGLIVQLVIRLDRPCGPRLLALVTVVAALAALRRRDGMPADTERPTLRIPIVGAISVVAMLAAVAIGGWAIAIATEGAHRQASEAHFSSLWLVPAGPARTPQPVSVGVTNHEGQTSAYQLTRHAGRQNAPAVAAAPRRQRDTWQAQLARPRRSPAPAR